jgi:hypothetical protein
LFAKFLLKILEKSLAFVGDAEKFKSPKESFVMVSEETEIKVAKKKTRLQL